MDVLLDDYPLLRKIVLEAGLTNADILSDLERTRARTLYRQTGDLLLSLDSGTEIAAKREEVEMRLQRFQVALAPHKRLPAEILANIFVCTLADDLLTFPTDMSLSPWVLRKVCSRWRQVALDESRLWNRIRLPVGFSSSWRPSLANNISLINMVLPTTGFLSMYRDPCIDNNGVPCPISVIDTIIIPNLPRLQELSLYLSIPTFQRLINEPNSLRSLKSLCLEIDCKHGDLGFAPQPQRSGSAVGFLNAANLRTLELRAPLHNKPNADAVLNLPFPWSQLTSLILNKINPFTPRDLHFILQKCHFLLQLHAVFSDRHRRVSGAKAPTMVDLPHLRRVELQGHVESDTPMNVQFLPWEQLITFDFLKLIGAARGPDIFHILTRCVRIEKLSVLRLEGHSTDLTHKLCFPRLTHLELYIKDTIILNQLTVPALTSLLIGTHRTLPFPAIDVLNMITRSGCSLSTFVHNGSLKDYGLEGLRQLLALLHCVHELRMRDLLFDKPILQRIGRGKILPRLTDLSCRLKQSTLLKFVDLLELRVKEGITMGAITPSLRWAKGYIRAVDVYREGGVRLEDALGRLKQLNAVHGTDFSIHVIKSLELDDSGYRVSELGGFSW